MTFTDDFGTAYPESARAYTKSRRFIDIDDKVLDAARSITKGSTNTDEAIMKIHEHVKSLPVTFITMIPSTPVIKASQSISSPMKKNLSYNKVIEEVSLLRSLGIPARPVSYICTTGEAGKLLGELPRSIKGSYLTLHYGTEVFAKDKNGRGEFRLKEAWIPQGSCKSIDERTCIERERKEWMEKREVKDVQNILHCTKLLSHIDFPGTMFNIINAAVTARNSVQFIEAFDPARGVSSW